ncbi:hypothetical protein BRLA_c040480 [Brevibacillus laterosporus LMG 15441]|uniref:Uncharacterized protein n=1 Tax=Brevibacillus laterosporus LMG 15441 TaxID=1042163 RepID=A0A075RGG8_BRELA|nr:hypothetical protein BRLA_c040480 [Brevibacillus laterosporus LMG 15441]
MYYGVDIVFEAVPEKEDLPWRIMPTDEFIPLI